MLWMTQNIPNHCWISPILTVIVKFLRKESQLNLICEKGSVSSTQLVHLRNCIEQKECAHAQSYQCSFSNSKKSKVSVRSPCHVFNLILNGTPHMNASQSTPVLFFLYTIAHLKHVHAGKIDRFLKISMWHTPADFPKFSPKLCAMVR